MNLQLKVSIILLSIAYAVTEVSMTTDNGQQQQSSSVSKSKVESLGETLKKCVVALKNVPQQQLDLVFLVDSSASVGMDNFNSELRFVNKLLADHTVSFNKTRVALVTFASKTHVIRHFDHLTNPSAENNKCTMLTEDLINITYSGGGTFTLGAMMEAQKIFEGGRANASRAVFLITDGYSNGGDPRPAAAKLRENGVQIFTFGIHNGNVQELMDMASEPKVEHSYILDSFAEFEALARRALHQDLHVGDHEVQERNMCDGLCKQPVNESGCCDEKAACSCGTHIGHYVCRCPPGFYGSGLLGDCLPCPAGTYGDTEGSSDAGGCRPCPEARNISQSGSSSISDCQCRHGFQLVNETCVAIECTKLTPPDNGHFVKNNCSNVYNSACGIRCNPGYKATGSSIRLCGENGEWSGQPTTCQIKHCPALKRPKHGTVSCDTQDYAFQTRCNFSCNDGFTLIGSKTRLCLAISSWDGIPAHCRSITCSPLSPPVNGSIIPSKCSQHKSQHGDTCSFSCNEGFVLMGARKRECGDRGRWSSAGKKSVCVDVTPPTIQCPEEVIIDTDPNESYATVTWNKPAVSDNSGVEPVVVSVPVTTDNTYLFPIGSSVVIFVAEDKANNKANCSFTVTVNDNESPTIDQCISPSTFLITDAQVPITWEDPVFSDNSGQQVQIASSHQQNTTFALGKTLVTYVATDESGNNNTCILTITLQEDKCAFPFDPANGHTNCSSAEEGTICSLTCGEGYAFAFENPDNYICAHDGSWIPSAEARFQDCSLTSLPNEATENVIMTLEADNVPCDDAFFMHQVENKFQQKLDVKLDFYCHEDALCDVTYISAACEEYLTEEEAEGSYIIRRRRSFQPKVKRPHQLVSIRFQLNVSSKGQLEEKTEGSPKLFNTISSVLSQMRKDAEQGQLDLRMGTVHLRYNKIRPSADGPRFLCPAGSVLRRKLCVRCPVGTFYNVVSETCQGCTRGTYQFLEGQLSCLVCPKNTSTSGGQLAKSLDDCKAQCLPGTVSLNGLEPCRTCKRGFYNPGYAKSDCIKCPDEMTTSRRGTRSKTQCREFCEENYVSQSGLQPCYPCPMGYLQPSRGSTLCYKCLDSSNCSKDAINRDVELPINDCFSVPCLNGGSCRLVSFGYVCDCSVGYTGMHCETDINECEAAPCRNGGQCVDGIGFYKCICPPGFLGATCEEDFDDCSSSPCLNGGKCVDWVNTFRCECPDGYRGKMCEKNMDECVDQPCLNGATCVQDVGKRRCICPDGFAGKDCQLNLNTCNAKPCLNDGICYEMGLGEFRCQCLNGFMGVLCETNVDDCQSHPCLNGGTCIDMIDAYLCNCPTGFVGQECQIKLSNNFVMQFQSSGISDYAQTEGFAAPLEHVSFCLWLKTTDSLNYGTSISYAVGEVDNSLTLTDTNGFVLYINGEKVITDLTASDGQWHIICVTWSATNGSWAIYKDGVLGDNGSGLSDNKTIPEGGALVIGQEQDKENGGFSQAEAFVGHMGWVNFWDYILAKDDIKGLMTTCDEYVGNIKGWPEFLSGLKGRVKLEESNFCKGCPMPERVVNGRVNVNGTTAQYQCNPGYSLIGNAERLCLIYGGWSGDEPECKRVNCGFPGYLENGHMESSGFEFRDEAHFKCKDGFRLEGQHTRLCQENGQWSGKSPECIEVHCLPLTSPENGYLNYSSSESLISAGTMATFSCFDGFRIDGSADSRCTTNGDWDEEPPLCQSIFCSNPPTVPNGYITNTSISEVLIGHYITFDCDVGYRVLPADFVYKMTCSEDRQWIGEIPQCVIIDCGQPPKILNTIYNFVDTTYDSVVDYSCDLGYKSASWALSCSDDGSWKGAEVQCEPVECPMLQGIRNGEFIVSYLKYNGTVTYSCMDGYILTGDSTRQCLSNGSWNGNAPTCSPINCPTPNLIKNGGYDHSYGKFIPGVVITYSCNIGYQRIGPSLITCLENGTWSQENPVCSVIECPTPSVIANGVYAGKDFHYGANISYACDRGYILVGNSSRICTDKQTWSGKQPECQKISCESVDNLKNGHVYFESFEFMSEIRYTCDRGFKLEGPHVRTCLANGLWTDEEPKCVLNRCPPLQPITNGDVKVTDSVAQYACNEGFLLKGEFQRYCEMTDIPLWSGTAPSCIQIQCTHPDLGRNVIAHVTNLNFGAVIEYHCVPGYKLANRVSSQNIRCQSDGSWSGQIPNCVAKRCPTLDYFPNGKILGSSAAVGAFYQFECESGYKLVGNESLICTDNETWSGNLPTCIPYACPWPLPRLKNGFLMITGYAVNDEVSYDCNHGYQLIGGPKTRLCLADGTWTGNEPQCVPVDCGQPDVSPNSNVIVNETTFDSNATYHCLEGYQIIGEATRTCTAERIWSSLAPNCQPLQCIDDQCDHLSCGQPPSIDRGYFLNFTSSFIGGTVTYACEDEFTLEGNPSKSCDVSRRWLPHDSHLRCVRTECPVLPFLQNGYNIYSATEIYVGATVTVECESDFYLLGDRARTCLSNGEWSGREAFCLRVECPNPHVSPNATIELDGTFVGANVRYKCNYGYVTDDVTIVTCMNDGQWSSREPFCRAIECPAPKVVKNGSVVDLGRRIGDVIYIRCDVGHRLVSGNSQRVCQENSTWSGNDPVCEVVNCHPIGTPFNGHVDILDSNPSKIAIYSCDEGYELTGNAQRVCQDDGNWSGQAPHCTIVRCPPIQSIENGWLIISDMKDLEPFSYGTTVAAVCNSNFMLNSSDNVRVRCLSDGQWDGPVPQCVRSRCDRWPIVPETVVSGDMSMIVGSEIEYQCREGFQIIGESRHRCSESGQWKGTIPKCVPVLCSKPPEVDHAVTRLFVPEGQSRFSFGASVAYTCQDGFELNGSAVLICNAKGEWMGRWPACVRTTCPPPPVVAHSTVQVENYEQLSRALYFCNQGYFLNSSAGNPVINCLSSGRWDDENNSMLCQPVECSVLPPLMNGHYDVNATKFVYGSIVRFKCSKGFRPVGNAKLKVKCSSSDHWVGKQPRCRPVTCPAPEVPSNSLVKLSEASVFGAEAIYSCPSGFKLEGMSKRICQDNGKWNGTVPQCLRIFCNELEPPANGYIMVTGSGKNYGDVARFLCAEDFVMRGANETVCGADGQWSSKIPKCRASWMVSCNPPQMPENTEETTTTTISEYDVGDEVNYRCAKGYINEESINGVAVCLNNGNWSFPSYKCQRVFCGPPATGDKNVELIEAVSFYFGDKVSFKCKAGTHPKDSKSEILCDEEGRWSFVPACEGLCPIPCLNGGVCIGPKKCRCVAGFVGDICQKAFCAKPCKNGGSCVAYNRCKCTSEFTGKQCEQRV